MNSSLLMICLLLGCGPLQKPKAAKETSMLEKLYQSMVDDVFLAHETFDKETLWPSVTDCDGTLWAGIAKASGLSTKLSLAEYKPGEIHRRPFKSCWTKEQGDLGSKSTVSQDMILGYMLGLWRSKDLAALQRLADYGESKTWVMGAPFPAMASRVVLRPNLTGTLGRAIFVLSGGKDKRAYRVLPLVVTPVSKDYERHLQALLLFLNGEIREAGGVEQVPVDLTRAELKRVEALIGAEPTNPLFHYLKAVYSGDFAQAIEFSLSAPMPSYARDSKENWLADTLLVKQSILARYGGRK